MRHAAFALACLVAALVGCKPPPPVAKAPPAPAPVKMERVKAEPGVGLKGRSLDDNTGMIVEPIKALFHTKEKIAFEIAFKHQYDLYRVENDAPKDFEDLRVKFLEPYLVKLPELPPGHKYIWDGETEQLMVERPVAQ